MIITYKLCPNLLTSRTRLNLGLMLQQQMTHGCATHKSLYTQEMVTRNGHLTGRHFEHLL